MRFRRQNLGVLLKYHIQPLAINVRADETVLVQRFTLTEYEGRSYSTTDYES